MWYLAVMIAALTAYFVADRRESLVLVWVLFLAPLFSLALQRGAMRGIGVECYLRGACRMGQEIAVHVTLRRNNRIPLGPVRLHMVFENILYSEKKEKVAWLQPGEYGELSFVYPFAAEDCGHMKIHVPAVEYQDLLGLFSFRDSVGIMEETLVYPWEIRLRAELSRRPETKSFGEMYDQQKKGQDVSEVAGIRDYVPGDSMNSIHWKLSGKLDQLVVREFGSPSNYNTLILYEMVKNFGEKAVPSAYNNAVLALTVSLSLSMLELNLEHNVGRVSKGDFQSVPVYSMDTHEQMQLSLLCVPVDSENSSADTVYSFMKSNLRNDFTKIIYITPCYEENTARQLSREVDLTVIQIVQGKGMDYTVSPGYSMISVDVDTYRETMHSITI